MKIIILVLLLLNLTSCYGTLRTYKDTMNNTIGDDISYIKLIYLAKLLNTHKYKEYNEYSMQFTSPFSKTKGVCTTIFKVRKSDNIIVSWRSEGKKSDCVWRGATE